MMTRRKLVTAAGGVALASASASAASDTKPMILQFTKLRLRNGADNQMARCSDFLANSVMPAAQRAGAGSMGFFASLVAPDTPYLLAVVSYPSLAAMESTFAETVAH